MLINYEGNELDLESGDLVLYYDALTIKYPMTVLSTIIREVTNCPYNHVAVVVKWGDTLMLCEALASGVICRPLKDHIERPYCKIAVLRSKAAINEESFVQKAISKLGIPYNYVGLPIELYYHITGIWTGKTQERAEKVMFCSEYAAWCHKMEEWWLWTAKEFWISDLFQRIYVEGKPLKEMVA